MEDMLLPRVGLALRANLVASQVGARLRRVRSPRYADSPDGTLSSNATLGRYAVPTLPNASAAKPRPYLMKEIADSR